MTKALIIVDVQYDFLPGGALAVPDGDKIIDPILRLENSKFYDYVVCSADYHPKNHSSFIENGGQWPTHCIQGTKGATVEHSILAVSEYYVQKGSNPEREAYSAFDGFVYAGRDIIYEHPPLSEFLASKNVNRVDVCGLALDYCVAATAISAARNKFETHVWLDLTRPVDYISACEAITEMQAAGVTFNFYQFELTEGKG
jgi:nicotinamidase/pyrazinamidase